MQLHPSHMKTPIHYFPSLYKTKYTCEAMKQQTSISIKVDMTHKAIENPKENKENKENRNENKKMGKCRSIIVKMFHHQGGLVGSRTLLRKKPLQNEQQEGCNSECCTSAQQSPEVCSFIALHFQPANMCSNVTHKDTGFPTLYGRWEPYLPCVIIHRSAWVLFHLMLTYTYHC